MKKLLMVLTGATLMLAASCNKKECDKSCEKECGANTTKSEVVAEVPNFEGTYEGTFPCADCSGIATKIVLKADGTFEKHQEYLEKKDGVFDTKGSFSFCNKSNKLNLKNEAGEIEVFKFENATLQLLDAEGNSSDAYKLTKK